MNIDKNFYPGWVRKAITFTVDDGNIPMDEKFISIVKPYGICGTFNLCSTDLNKYTPEFYRELYDGFGISNHCKLHPFALNDNINREISDDAFSPDTADVEKLYKTARRGLYHYHVTAGWRKIAEPEVYCALISECHSELEAVFGKGSVTTFVWPYGEQKGEDILKYIADVCGYIAVRKTGLLGSSTGFSLPDDMMHWTYNANHKNLLSSAEEYEAYKDDGNLKFFSFGIHSIDYERANAWDDLSEFAKRYGDRKKDFYYASVEKIFEYSKAVDQLKITENTVENPTSFEIFVKIDGKNTTIPSKTILKL